MLIHDDPDHRFTRLGVPGGAAGHARLRAYRHEDGRLIFVFTALIGPSDPEMPPANLQLSLSNGMEGAVLAARRTLQEDPDLCIEHVPPHGSETASRRAQGLPPQFGETFAYVRFKQTDTPTWRAPVWDHDVTGHEITLLLGEEIAQTWNETAIEDL